MKYTIPLSFVFYIAQITKHLIIICLNLFPMQLIHRNHMT